MRVVRNIGNDGHHVIGPLKVRVGKQHNACQRAGQHAQGVTTQCVAAPRIAQQLLQALRAGLRQVAPQARHVQGEFQVGDLAGIEAVLQVCSGDGVVEVQRVLEVGAVLAANVQFAAQAGIGRHADTCVHVGQGIEMPGGGGRGDKTGWRLVGVVSGFAGFKVMQGGVQQRHGPGSHCAGAHGEPRDGRRYRQAQVGVAHIALHTKALLERLLQHGRGKVGG